jgi:hypothetical protein
MPKASEETLDKQRVRHFGRFYPVTARQAKLHGHAVRILWRRGTTNLGKLANAMHLKIDDAEFKDCVKWLAEHQIIEVKLTYYGDDGREASLTETGKEFGVDLAVEKQLAGGPVDGE